MFAVVHDRRNGGAVMTPDWHDWQHYGVWIAAFTALCAIVYGCYGIWLGIR